MNSPQCECSKCNLHEQPSVWVTSKCNSQWATFSMSVLNNHMIKWSKLHWRYWYFTLSGAERLLPVSVWGLSWKSQQFLHQGSLSQQMHATSCNSCFLEEQFQNYQILILFFLLLSIEFLAETNQLTDIMGILSIWKNRMLLLLFNLVSKGCFLDV